MKFNTLSCSHAACLQESVAPLFFATSSALLGGAARPFDTRDVLCVRPCSIQQVQQACSVFGRHAVRYGVAHRDYECRVASHASHCLRNWTA